MTLGPRPDAGPIGVLGGTFDPVHFGHLRAALDCLQALRLAQVRLVPLKVAVHRAQPAAPPALRLAMLEAAIKGQPGLVTDARELGRSGGSYTYETLRSLRDDCGADRPLCLLLGADAYRGFLDWHRPLDILDVAHLVVMRRPGHDPVAGPSLRALYLERACTDPAELARSTGGRILFQEVTQLEIASTHIRALIARGLSPRYLLPEPVLELIRREGLYV
jgi:nicotinate-nucleotide adenylyltransferase